METASCPRWYHDSGVCHGTAIRDGQPAGLPAALPPLVSYGHRGHGRKMLGHLGSPGCLRLVHLTI